MKKLIEQWIVNDGNKNKVKYLFIGNALPGFSNFVLTDAMPVMLKQPFKTEFDLQDAGTMQVKFST
jgi:hypothetical protein